MPPGLDRQAYDSTGLDLARQIAGAVNGRTVRRRPRRRSRPIGPEVSGAAPDDRDPQLLGAGLARLFESRGWSMRVNLQTLLARWPAIVGEVNAEHSRPEGFDDGVLTVRTDATVWASSLRTIAPQVVARLNSDLGEGAVTRIVVRGPDAPSWKHGRYSVRGRGVRDTYG
ncbi:DUF721 domain-containing protein [Naumannella halotolerans]|uniref:DUF721 domain-containing protein n=1 Tax=Naumannella halotolerans TaxID=993414 RepID=UPI001FBAFDBC|nr:DciA family protein [Naumannella halotolerans]